MDLRDGCAQYFRQRPGWRRILTAMLEKYRGLGRVGGSVRLDDAGETEYEAVRALFGRPFPPPLKLGLLEFEKALQATKYRGVTLPELLAAYFEIPLQTKREICAQRDGAYASTLDKAMGATESEDCLRWLRALGERRGGGEQLLQQCIAQGNGLQALLQVCAAKHWLETHRGEPVRLAVLSARATTDPHALDENTQAGKLLLYLLAFCAGQKYQSGAEERDTLYFQGGILCDSISSSVTQIGLYFRAGDGEHPAFRAFRLLRESCTLTLTNLAGLSGAESLSGRAYLVENQMLFSQLCDHAANFHSPLICTSGQLQVAVLRLLDLLAASGTALFYAGDFDVGGLSIASRLLERYPERLRLWRMSPEDYRICQSEKTIDSARLDGLESNAHPALTPLVSALRETGRAGYQELLLPGLLHDLTVTP